MTNAKEWKDRLLDIENEIWQYQQLRKEELKEAGFSEDQIHEIQAEFYSIRYHIMEAIAVIYRWDE